MTVEQQAPSWIKFLTAEQWGRTLIHPMATEQLNDPETYVHHTAGNPYRNSNAQVAMRLLQTMSHNKGYATVAYDVVVHRSASGLVTIMEGRGAGRSAATLDRNEEGEAVCIMGYFHPGNALSEEPTDRDIEGIAWGITWAQERGWSAPDTKILGHRDNPAHPNATSCPGDYLYNQLPLIRNLVATINTPSAPPIIAPPTEGEEVMLLGYIKHPDHPAVYRQWNNGTKTWVTDGEEFLVHAFVNGKPIDVKVMPNNAWMRATGVIVGPIPAGVDIYGQPI
jgi:hypothetical protein